MPPKLLRHICKTQIGYYYEGEWKPKVNFNFKLHTYVSEETFSKDKVLGWIGQVCANEAPDKTFKVFFPIPVFFPIDQYIIDLGNKCMYKIEILRYRVIDIYTQCPNKMYSLIVF